HTLAECVTTNIFARNFSFVMLSNPTQCATSNCITLTKTDLAQRSATVGPKIVSYQRCSCLDVLGFYPVWLCGEKGLAGRSSRPLKIRKRSGKSQHMGWRFRPPFPLPAIKAFFFLVRKVPKLLEGSPRSSREAYTANNELAIILGW